MTRATKLLSVSAFVVAAVDVLAFVVAVASMDLSPTALRIARLTARLKYFSKISDYKACLLSFLFVRLLVLLFLLLLLGKVPFS